MTSIITLPHLCLGEINLEFRYDLNLQINRDYGRSGYLEPRKEYLVRAVPFPNPLHSDDFVVISGKGGEWEYYFRVLGHPVHKPGAERSQIRLVTNVETNHDFEDLQGGIEVLIEKYGGSKQGDVEPRARVLSLPKSLK